MTTANRIDPRGSGFYLTFDSPSDFLATLGGRENPCTAIFHPRDFPTNAVDPEGLRDLTPPGYRPTPVAPLYHGSWIGNLSKFNLFLWGKRMKQDYGPETGESKDMQTDVSRINLAVDEWCRRPEKDKGKLIYPDDLGPNSKKNWGFNGGPIQAGINPTRHFVGGYGVRITPVEGALKFEVVNETSLKSLLYDIAKFDKEWATRNMPTGLDIKMFQTQTQHYYWYIPTKTIRTL